MLIVFATIVAVTAAAPNKLVTTNSHSQTKNLNSVCETPACIQEASRMLKKIDQNIDPCSNFYQFACGKFMKEMVTPNDTLEVTVFSLIKQKLRDQIRHSISDETKKNDLSVFKSINIYYQACMDTEKIEKNIENDLKEIIYGISWNENWEKFLPEVYRRGSHNYLYFMAVLVEDDRYRGDNSKYIITIDSPELLHTPKQLSNSANISDPVIKAYLKYITDVVSILEADVTLKKKDFVDLLQFEHKLARLSHIRTEKQQLMTVTELENKYPNISWTEYLNGTFAPEVHIDQSETIAILNENYIKGFHSLITTTPKSVIKNYVQWSLIRESIMNTRVGRLADAFAEFNAVRFGRRNSLPPRQNWCMNKIKTIFPKAIGALYIRFYFDENMKSKAANLVKNIRSSFRDMIEQANWIDSITKKEALEKLDLMKEVVGYPDELMDDNKLNEYYKDLKVYPESHLKSSCSVQRFQMKQSLLKLRKSKYDIMWQLISNTAEVNAFYLLFENLISIGAGILQEELFAVTSPNYMNYGGIGWIIGHEITHGFDNMGSKYDKNGNFVEWWEPKTRETYLNKVKCIIEQYNNYTVKEVNMRVNGYSSQGENIADNGGLKAAYYAYNQWAQSNGPEPQLPGLDYTPNQMFWISAATSRCSKLTLEYLEEYILGDVHAPEEFRVIGSMSNIPEFSKDFQCPLGLPMNPAKKCSVW